MRMRDSVCRSVSNANRYETLISALQESLYWYAAIGCIRLLKVLRRKGYAWNSKHAHRFYCELVENKRAKSK